MRYEPALSEHQKKLLDYCIEFILEWDTWESAETREYQRQQHRGFFPEDLFVDKTRRYLKRTCVGKFGYLGIYKDSWRPDIRLGDLKYLIDAYLEKHSLGLTATQIGEALPQDSWYLIEYMVDTHKEFFTFQPTDIVPFGFFDIVSNEDPYESNPCCSIDHLSRGHNSFVAEKGKEIVFQGDVHFGDYSQNSQENWRKICPECRASRQRRGKITKF